MFKVAKPVAGASEPPPLPPTTVVADFKRRRKETEAERFAFLEHFELAGDLFLFELNSVMYKFSQ